MWPKVTSVSILFVVLLFIFISGCTESDNNDDVKVVELSQQQSSKLAMKIVNVISSCTLIDENYEIVAVKNSAYQMDTSDRKGILCITNSTIKYSGSNHKVDTIIYLPENSTTATAMYAVLDNNYNILTGKYI